MREDQTENIKRPFSRFIQSYIIEIYKVVNFQGGCYREVEARKRGIQEKEAITPSSKNCVCPNYMHNMLLCQISLFSFSGFFSSSPFKFSFLFLRNYLANLVTRLGPWMKVVSLNRHEYMTVMTILCQWWCHLQLSGHYSHDYIAVTLVFSYKLCSLREKEITFMQYHQTIHFLHAINKNQLASNFVDQQAFILPLKKSNWQLVTFIAMMRVTMPDFRCFLHRPVHHRFCLCIDNQININIFGCISNPLFLIRRINREIMIKKPSWPKKVIKSTITKGFNISFDRLCTEHQFTSRCDCLNKKQAESRERCSMTPMALLWFLHFSLSSFSTWWAADVWYEVMYLVFDNAFIGRDKSVGKQQDTGKQ